MHVRRHATVARRLRVLGRQGMKIKRFVAPDMRQAMRAVREDQGPDAVILFFCKQKAAYEIIAAVDFDEALVREAARHGAPLEVEGRAPARAAAVPEAELP